MTTYKIVIPEPCTVGRENMDDTANGSYCHACKKEVIDFTNKTNSEIVDLIRKNTGGICGRIHPKQLDRVYAMPLEYQYTKAFNKGIIGAAFSLFVALFYVKAEAKDVKPVIEMQAKINGENKLFDAIDEPTDSNYVIIKGQVIDISALPLNGVVISLPKYPHIKTTTNGQGKYNLKIPKKIYSDSTEIRFSRFEYEDMQFELQTLKSIHYMVQMVYDRHMMIDDGMMFILPVGE